MTDHRTVQARQAIARMPPLVIVLLIATGAIPACMLLVFFSKGDCWLAVYQALWVLTPHLVFLGLAVVSWRDRTFAVVIGAGACANCLAAAPFTLFYLVCPLGMFTLWWLFLLFMPYWVVAVGVAVLALALRAIYWKAERFP